MKKLQSVRSVRQVFVAFTRTHAPAAHRCSLVTTLCRIEGAVAEVYAL